MTYYVNYQPVQHWHCPVCMRPHAIGVDKGCVLKCECGCEYRHPDDMPDEKGD